MPVLAGWLTGEQVPTETIEQTLSIMSETLGRHGGQLARTIQAGMGLIAFSDPSYAMQHNDDPPVLDWVPDRRTLVYRRPLSGAHPLYYVENWPAQGNLLFSSEIRALLEVGVPRRLHVAALDVLLRYGFIPAPWTTFKDIRIVPAGSILRWQRSKVVVNAATDYRLDEPLKTINDAFEQVQEQLNEATTGILPPHDQLVAFTGGETPSALSALLAAQQLTTPFTLATLGYTKRTTTKGWKQAEQIAEACQRPFLEIAGVDQPEFWVATLLGLEAPSVDTRPVAMHQLLHTSSSETGARVAISGLGANVLTGQIPSLSAGPMQKNLLGFYAQAHGGSIGKMSHLWSREVARTLQKEERWEDTLHARKLARRADQFKDRRQGWYYLDLHLRLPDKIVHTAQQLATQEQLVVRSPYLTTHMLDTLTRLPATLNGGISKGELLEQLRQRILPDEVKARATLPLIAPVASLTQIGESELLQQILSPEAVKAADIFDVGVVNELLKGQGDTRELMLVFTTQLLWQLFGMGM